MADGLNLGEKILCECEIEIWKFKGACGICLVNNTTKRLRFYNFRSHKRMKTKTLRKVLRYKNMIYSIEGTSRDLQDYWYKIEEDNYV